jgi:putative flippase GtrA
MSDLVPGGGRQPSRKQREDRAYRLVVAGGVAGAVAVVTAVLAIAGVLGWGIPFLTAAIAAICAFLFRRAVSR